MAPHSSTLAWKIPWTEEPGGLQSMGWRRVDHDWVTWLSLFTFMHWRRKWQPTPVFLPGESQGRGILAGCRRRRVGHNWSDAAAAAVYLCISLVIFSEKHTLKMLGNIILLFFVSVWFDFLCPKLPLFTWSGKDFLLLFFQKFLKVCMYLFYFTAYFISYSPHFNYPITPNGWL